jgi:hypothetical protein
VRKFLKAFILSRPFRIKYLIPSYIITLLYILSSIFTLVHSLLKIIERFEYNFKKEISNIPILYIQNALYQYMPLTYDIRQTTKLTKKNFTMFVESWKTQSICSPRNLKIKIYVW